VLPARRNAVSRRLRTRTAVEDGAPG
jgi:hypothetical protein